MDPYLIVRVDAGGLPMSRICHISGEGGAKTLEQSLARRRTDNSSNEDATKWIAPTRAPGSKKTPSFSGDSRKQGAPDEMRWGLLFSVDTTTMNCVVISTPCAQDTDLVRTGECASNVRGTPADSGPMTRRRKHSSGRMAAPMKNLLHPVLIVVGAEEDPALRASLESVDDISVRRVTAQTVAELDDDLTCTKRGEALVPVGILGSLDGEAWLLSSTARLVARHWTGVPIAVTARRRTSRLDLLFDEMAYGAPTILENEVEIARRVELWHGFRRRERKVAEEISAAYGFTSRVEQVCIAVHYGCRRAHLPTVLGVKECTAATHLSAVYADTGVKNYEGLVGLLKHASRRHLAKHARARREPS